jgi:hypothetical protein
MIVARSSGRAVLDISENLVSPLDNKSSPIWFILLKEKIAGECISL